MARSHLVLVPGFGGFDALGQMLYYAPEICRRAEGRDLTLHFFDNLPTAGVETRGKKLIEFLGKLVGRNVIREKESLTLLGHSTGGLDIRWAINRWKRHVDRVVFMSVPQRGTNIADFVDAHGVAVGAVRLGLRSPTLAAMEVGFAKAFGHISDSDIISKAIPDARAEVQPNPDRWLAAQARRAAGELSHWREEMAIDFAAIDDLKTGCFKGNPVPSDVQVLSFATRADNPFDTSVTFPEQVRGLFDVRSLADDNALDASKTDGLFRLAYAACSAGPFKETATLDWLPELKRPQKSDPVERWHNDGIVNTASMVGETGQTWLVPGDHGDIIGHFKAILQANQATGRKHESYDLLKSNAAFDQATFEAVWDRVFNFAVT